MANALADLVVNLQANTASFSRGMQDAVGQLDRFNTNVERRMASLGTMLQRSFGAAAIGTAVAGMAREMTQMVEAAIDAADHINKVSQSTGVGVETLTGYAFAARLADVDLDELAKSLAKLSKNMFEAEGGTSSAAKAFKKLGIDVKDTAAPIDEVMLKIADRFSRMPDGMEKTAIAQELFGKSGARLIPLLNQGSSGLAEMTAKARELGLVLDPGTTQAAENFNDNLEIMRGRVDGVFNAIAADLLPALAELSRKMAEGANVGVEHGWLRELANDFGIGTIALGHGIKNTYDILGTSLREGWALAKRDYETVANEHELLNDRLRSRWEDLKESVQNIEKPPLGLVGRTRNFLTNPGGDNGGAASKALAAQLESARAQMQSILDRIAQSNGDTVDRLYLQWDEYARKWQKLVSKFPQIAKEFPGVLIMLGAARDREIAAELEKQLDAIIKKAEEYRHIKPIPGIFVMPDVKAPNVPAKNPYELELDELARNTEELGRAATDVWYQTRTAAEQYAFELERLNILLDNGKISQETYNRAMDQLKARLDRNTIAMREFGYEAGQALENAMFRTHDWKQALEEVIQALIRMAFQLLVVNRIQEALAKSGKGGGVIGGIIGGLSGSWGGFRAEGGPMDSGKWYIAGERGPEPIYMGSNGYAFANDMFAKMKGGGETVIHIDARGADAGVEARIMRAMSIYKTQAVQESVLAVEERRRRS